MYAGLPTLTHWHSHANQMSVSHGQCLRVGSHDVGQHATIHFLLIINSDSDYTGG